ncbi:hypothetical protein RHSIM_Rhsim09G0121500 [Rhododendron simsii]|uniref:O-fucosyltransferase family protein n=1 Tax=Rhododendron simsii TaxID=118357 RepID=A0A834GHB8_RHOSS|nr:hypothetical protein RHSIM_Rhsim09G0121500 [Rhododendron simsii]
MHHGQFSGCIRREKTSSQRKRNHLCIIIRYLNNRLRLRDNKYFLIMSGYKVSMAEIVELKEKEFDKKGVKYLGKIHVEKMKYSVVARARLIAEIKIWAIRVMTLVLVWACAWQLVALSHAWGPRVVQHWSSAASVPSIPPAGPYKSNGYLMVSSNGGLNQMRAGICDMVAIARYMNVTLIVPELDKTSFWNDQSQFNDIFDVDYFITSLRDEVQIQKELPPTLKRVVAEGTFYSMPPVSWSNMSYYLNTVLPQIEEYELLHLTKTDARLANNGLPTEVQKLRCRVNYNALRFTPAIEKLGRKIVEILRQKGPFLVLHLRYEMDMLAFSGCNEGCNDTEVDELTKMRYAYPWWKEKEINSTKKRKAGLCPLTPEETALTLRALDIDKNIQIYIAAGDIYGGKRRLASLAEAFPNLVKKETLLQPSELLPFQNHSSQMAALDYIVSIESDIFVPTIGGNMAKVVEGHRRFLGFKKTLLPDRQLLVNLIDKYNTGKLNWEKFSLLVKDAHASHWGTPTKRIVIPGKPKLEDYFWSNPQECLPPTEELSPM